MSFSTRERSIAAGQPVRLYEFRRGALRWAWCGADRDIVLSGGAFKATAISDDGVVRRVEGLTIIDYPMSQGSVAGYYPELNPLLPLSHYDMISGCPAAKSIPVRVVAAASIG